MAPKLGRLAVIVPIGLLIGALVAAAAITFLLGRTSPPTLPNANGYDDLLKAGGLVVRKLDEISDLDHDGLRVILSTNVEPLRLLRIGLNRKCQVPTDATIANFTVIMSDLINLKAAMKASRDMRPHVSQSRCRNIFSVSPWTHSATVRWCIVRKAPIGCC